MTTRFDVERALENSDLPSIGRHIVLVLCSRMDQGSTLIPPQFSPSLTTLARATGRDRRTIVRHLDYLERAGWVHRRRPTRHLARTRYVTTAYTVTMPDPQVIHLVAENPHPEGAVPPDLMAGGPGPRGTEPHNQTETDPMPDPEIEIVISELEKRTGRTIDAEWAAKTRDFILARPGVRNRKGYLRQVLAADPDPARFLPTSQPPPYKAPKKEKS